jgi:hypothetical protein
MTKKHFIALAKILKANHAPPSLVTALADWLQTLNPNFDRERFVEACM